MKQSGLIVMGWLPRFVALTVALLAPPVRAQDLQPAYRDLSRGMLTQVDAIAPDIVRVRIVRGTALPEDASWAVLPDMRRARAATVRAVDGFSTPSLSLHADRAIGAFTITDPGGKVIVAVTAPPAFDGARFTVSTRLTDGEHIFGLGDKTGPLDRRGRSFVLWNTDAGITDTQDPTYKSIPFYVSVGGEGGAYGILLDNTWRSAFDFGHRDRGVASFSADGGPVDFYVIAGPTPAHVVERYADLTGHPPLMPKWALGYQQSRYSYTSADEVRALVDRFRTDRFPLDVVWLDIDYQDRNRPFTTNPVTFPDMAGLVRDIGAKGVKLVAITDLHVAAAPGQGYVPYDEGIAGDRFVHAANGGVYSGVVWPGRSVFPDFTQDAARHWWGTLYRRFVQDGVAGFWNDMNEPSVFFTPTSTMPLDNLHRIDGSGFAPRQATHAEVHNVFGMQNTRGTYEGLEQLRPAERPFVMTRATFAGGQRYAATWTGDNYSSWGQLHLAVDMTLNLGLSGFAWTANDVGGFGGGPSAALLTRWFQVAAFMPIFRDHATKGSPPQEPWVDGPEQKALRRAAVEERYRLFPYLYALAEEAHRTGAPIMRPIFYDHPEMAKVGCPGSTTFALGRSILVATATYGESPAPFDACLPAGRWFDYWTDAEVVRTVKDDGIFGKTDVVRLTPRPDRLPVFVAEGTILPKRGVVQSLSEPSDAPLELHVWPGPSCAAMLYDDDGKASPDARGAFLRRRIGCTGRMGGARTTISIGAAAGNYRPAWRRIQVIVHGWGPPRATARLDGRKLPAALDSTRHTATLEIDPAPAAMTIDVAG